MRLSFAILLVAAIFLARGCEAVVSVHPTEISTMASSALAPTGPTVGEKRTLRYRVETDEEKKNDDEEERKNGANLFTADKLKLMVGAINRAERGDKGGLDSLYKRFSRWDRERYTSYNLPSILMDSKYDKLRQKYHSYLYN
ncbi:RxLR effector protein [Phytophthora megakarya]|uniref:RxLR effector protein n=1 Tax=Phytophthora megakarya TaxID=4795 RepID=A0A225VSK8_9STRA|nr:RxLR effector protein [Phytophthora megakarya]